MYHCTYNRCTHVRRRLYLRRCWSQTLAPTFPENTSNGKSRRIVVHGGAREAKDHAAQRESCFRSAPREEIERPLLVGIKTRCTVSPRAVIDAGSRPNSRQQSALPSKQGPRPPLVYHERRNLVSADAEGDFLNFTSETRAGQSIGLYGALNGNRGQRFYSR